MLIGYTDKMSDEDVAALADWADYQAKEVPNPTWKRAYSLIREGADLLLRRRALSGDKPLDPTRLSAEDQQRMDKSVNAGQSLHKTTNARSHSYDHV